MVAEPGSKPPAAAQVSPFPSPGPRLCLPDTEEYTRPSGISNLDRLNGNHLPNSAPLFMFSILKKIPSPLIIKSGKHSGTTLSAVRGVSLKPSNDLVNSALNYPHVIDRKLRLEGEEHY